MILALDTSCYTTSLALMGQDGRLWSDQRRVLAVPAKQRGLLQSEALFQHIHNLPAFLEELAGSFDFRELTAIGVSVKPRPLEKSYMPVFLGGQSFARTLAATLKVPLFEATHQEGHLLAGWHSLAMLERIPGEFLFCHFSGGTSELLLVQNRGQGNFTLTLKAFGNDLHAGQFVDRIGVLLGLAFPCGTALEKLAMGHKGNIPSVKIWVKDSEFSFSGQETAIRRLAEQGLPPATVARTVEDTVARTLAKALQELIAETGVSTVLLAGGVMCNAYIKNYLRQKLTAATLYFAEPRYASDNAVGVAALTLLRMGGIDHGLAESDHGQSTE